MKELTEILETIDKTVDYYDSMTMEDTHKLSEVLRRLTSYNFYLAKYKIEYHNEWLKVYNESEGTNAAKERTADNKVKELYMCRHIHSQVNRVMDSIRSQLGVYKQER